jgi:hypothetical protein
MAALTRPSQVPRRRCARMKRTCTRSAQARRASRASVVRDAALEAPAITSSGMNRTRMRGRALDTIASESQQGAKPSRVSVTPSRLTAVFVQGEDAHQSHPAAPVGHEPNGSSQAASSAAVLIVACAIATASSAIGSTWLIQPAEIAARGMSLWEHDAGSCA